MIAHLDADAFFASVEQAADPSLRHRPIAVGGSVRGVVTAASYEAKERGVYTPMPTSRARTVCPELTVVPVDFEKYRLASSTLFDIASDICARVEQASIDEGYLDLTGHSLEEARRVALQVQRRAWEEIGIGISVGVAPNKLAAQVASKLNKPSGFVSVDRGEEASFLSPLDIKVIPGIGKVAQGKLRACHIHKVGQLATAPLALVRRAIGNSAPYFQSLANGIDNRPVRTERGPAKSIGHQRTLGTDLQPPGANSPGDLGRALDILRQLTDSLAASLRKKQRSARTLTVRVRYSDWSEFSRSVSLPDARDLPDDFYPHLPDLLDSAWHRPAPLRLVGLSFSNLEDHPASPDLFELAGVPVSTTASPAAVVVRPYNVRTSLYTAIDTIRSSLYRAPSSHRVVGHGA